MHKDNFGKGEGVTLVLENMIHYVCKIRERWEVVCLARGVSIEDWDNPEGLALLEKWSTLSLADIADRMSISVSTLKRWCKKSEAIRAVLYDREMCEAVEREVYACCFDRVKTVTIKKQVLDKEGNVHELTEIKQVAIPADGRAQRYWLNNRNPNRWRDKVEVSVEAHEGGTLALPVVDLLDGEDAESTPGKPF